MWRNNTTLTKYGSNFFKVLDLIIQDQGGNDTVEINRVLTDVRLWKKIQKIIVSGDESNEEKIKIKKYILQTRPLSSLSLNKTPKNGNFTPETPGGRIRGEGGQGNVNVEVDDDDDI